MKKSLLKFLCLSLSAILLISCGNPAESSTTESTTVSTTETTTEPTQTTASETTTEPIQTTETTTEPTLPTPEYFVSPEDEVEATKTFTATNKDGIELSITVHGYASESLDMDFYAKNDDYILFDIQVTNRSDSTIYQFIPTVTEFPTLEGTIKAAYTNGQLHIIDMFGLQEAIRIGELAPNETATRYNLRALAKTTEEDFDSSGRGYFVGPLWLPYGVDPLTPQNIYRVPTNNHLILCNISFYIVNVIEPTQTTTEPTLPTPDYFVSPADEVKATKSFTKTSPDGIEFTVTFHGYKCKSNSLDDMFYVKSNETIDIDIQVVNNSDSTIYQFYGSTPTEFPVIHSCINNIAIGGNGHLNLGQMYGFQDAIDIAELAPGESKVKSHTITVSSDAIFTAPLDNFGGHFYIQYGVDFENRQHFAYDIILSVLVSVAHIPETN